MEIEDLRQATQHFCKKEITPEVAAKADLDNSFPNELWSKLGAAGLLGITAPEEYGGRTWLFRALCCYGRNLES